MELVGEEVGGPSATDGENAKLEPEARAASRPLAGLDFRREALAAWPRWLWPPASYWKRRAPAWMHLPLRLWHAFGVLASTLVGIFALPVALVARRLLRKKRAVRREANRSPDRVLDLVASWRGSDGDGGSVQDRAE